MRKRFFSVFLFLCFFSTMLSSIAAADSVRWVYSHNTALRDAKKYNAPIMIDFYTDWCGWCGKLDKETYRDNEVIQLSHSFICLKLDGDKNRDLVKKYKVTGYPTVLFTDPKGKVIGGGAGFRSATKLLNEMQSVLSELQAARKEPAGNIIKSSTGSIGAFAKDWEWSKERNQDGEFAETRIDINLPGKFKSATLVLAHGYSQEAGMANARVYISSERQVPSKDAAHNKGKWWVGDDAKFGRYVGSFESQYTYNPPARFDVTSFLKEHPANTYYVAVQNFDYADIGVNKIYIEVEE